jgi:phosphatidylserine/phosphatidylglycerophosphate/cardiolipin synthase-like enzyme
MALSTTPLPPIVPDSLKVKPRGKNTVVHPFDPVDKNASLWLPSGVDKFSAKTPNEVVPYIDGHAAFKDMVAAIHTATQRGDFIFLIGWVLRTAFELIPGDPTTTIESLFRAASARNVEIRALLYHQNKELSGEDNTKPVDFINGLPNAKAIHDDRVVRGALVPWLIALLKGGHYLGVHHQKVLVVYGNEGLVAFQGGMDINPDRLQFPIDPAHGIPYIGGPVGLHDVHTRIRGEAAISLCSLFVQRWNDHPQSAGFTIPPSLLFGKHVYGNVSHELHVAVGRTYPNSTAHTLNGPGGPYWFAETGEQSAKTLVLNAIAQSKRFIYIEDQYLFDMDLSNALKSALPNLKKLIILILTSEQAPDQHQPFLRRKNFIDNLTGGVQPPTDKVIVCQNRWPAMPFVHSKTFIFDDKFAIVGSANANHRGYTFDSEQTAGIFDTNEKKRFFFAHELRMHLWHKHLHRREIDLVDPIASSVHWSKPIGDIITYVLAGQDPPPPFPENIVPKDLVWNLGIDPDGS